ncbi:MAG: hypothetical protein OXR67_00310 [Chloroflexota bacterium]|nr:hypothetical protein [Chloroflexota bacterium]
MPSGLLMYRHNRCPRDGRGRRIFRASYNRFATFEPFDDGLGIMREAHTAKPQSFINGNGRLVYNLAVNLAEM